MAVLGGAPPRLRVYGIVDDEALEVGLPVAARYRSLSSRSTRICWRRCGLRSTPSVRSPSCRPCAATRSGTCGSPRPLFAPRTHMYVFGAVDHAAAVATIGRFLGYRVTVCDARSRFVTRERFPDIDELVVSWPDEFCAARQSTAAPRSSC
jgi:xanthine dehydrogenase accessory factor